MNADVLKCSVIISTWNRAAMVTKVIDAVLAQDTKVPHEIIIVDNNSTDDTRERVHDYVPQVQYVHEPTQGTASARNAGIAIARGEILAFLDDDCPPDPNWLEAVIQTFDAYPDAWAVGGKTLVADGAPQWIKDSAHFLGFTDFGDTTMLMDWKSVRGNNFAFRTSVVARVGPFDPKRGYVGNHRSVYCEDAEMGERIEGAGGRLYHCGHATVRHAVHGWYTMRYVRWEWSTKGRTEALFRGVLSAQDALRETTIFIKEIAKLLGSCVFGRWARAFQYELSLRRRAAYIWHGTVGWSEAMKGENYVTPKAGPWKA